MTFSFHRTLTDQASRIKTGRRLRIGSVLSALLIGGQMMPPASAQAPAEIEPMLLAPRVAAASEASPERIRERGVDHNIDALREIETQSRGTATLNFFDDAAFLISFDKRHERVPARAHLGTTWSGSIVNDPLGWFVFTLEGGVVAANLWTGDGRAFQIATGPDGGYLAQELDLSKFAPCAGSVAAVPAGPADEQNAATRGGGCPDDGSEIDVMVVYTPAARSAAGGTSQIQALIANSIAATNDGYANSAIHPRLRLVHAAEVDYTSSNFETDLARLRGTTDGYMDEIHAWRDEYRADMVALLRAGSSEYCGIAYLMPFNSPTAESYAFSVTRYNCSVGTMTFPHELGHNQGCCHARGDGGGCTGGGLYSYSVGHRFNDNFGVLRRTIMAYSPGSRIQHFSNPDILFNGVPTGVPVGQPDDADNALTINQAAWAVANFRAPGVGVSITQQPPSQYACAGDNVLLAVIANGPPPLSYQWRRNGEPIEGATENTYLIPSAMAGDEGDYDCIVSDGFDCPQPSTVATLTVNSPPCPSYWMLVDVSGPSARDGHALAFEETNGRVVLFGGNVSGSGKVNDTWVWNGNNWTQAASTGPSARDLHAMAYDAAHDRVVLFGGCCPPQGDTWTWNGTAWTLSATTGPAIRARHAMAYDAGRARVVMFGGFGGGSIRGDTWEWNGTSWTQVATTGPAPRYHHAMAYDAARGKVVLFGGYATGYLSDTWEWNGTAWTQVATDGPSPRERHAMAYHPLRQRVVLFGGANGSELHSDTWEWDGAAWSPIPSSFGPAGRWAHAITYDAERGRLVMFGGLNNFGDTWEYRVPCVPADLNGDGFVTPADVPSFVTILLDPIEGTALSRCSTDANQDGFIDARDVQAFVDLLLE
jgi:hypothetical protein